MEISKVAQGGVPSFPGEGMGRAPETKVHTPSQTQVRTEVKVAVDDANDRQILSKEEAKKVISGLNEILSLTNSHLKFMYHEKLKQYYATIVDNNTNQVVKEIPPKKLLDVVASIWEQIGIIVDYKV